MIGEMDLAHPAGTGWRQCRTPAVDPWWSAVVVDTDGTCRSSTDRMITVQRGPEGGRLASGSADHKLSAVGKR